MIGTNKVILNIEQVQAVFEKHLKDELLKDGEFTVSNVTFEPTTQTMTVTLGPK